MKLNFVENKEANRQINEIYKAIKKGDSPAEITNAFNESGEKNYKSSKEFWNQEEIKELIQQFKLDTNNPLTIQPVIKQSQRIIYKPKYKLVNTMRGGEMFAHGFLWAVFIVFTFGLALPFFIYSLIKTLINYTEIHERMD